MSCFLLFVTLISTFQIAKIERKPGLWARVVDISSHGGDPPVTPSDSAVLPGKVVEGTRRTTISYPGRRGGRGGARRTITLCISERNGDNIMVTGPGLHGP